MVSTCQVFSAADDLAFHSSSIQVLISLSCIPRARAARKNFLRMALEACPMSASSGFWMFTEGNFVLPLSPLLPSPLLF